MSNYHKKFALDFAKFGSITGIGFALITIFFNTSIGSVLLDSNFMNSDLVAGIAAIVGLPILLGQGFIYGYLTLFILNKYFKINRSTKILWLTACTVSFLIAVLLSLGANTVHICMGWC